MQTVSLLRLLLTDCVQGELLGVLVWLVPGSAGRLLPRSVVQLEWGGGQGGPLLLVVVAGVVVARPPGAPWLPAPPTLQAVTPPCPALQGGGAVAGLGRRGHALYVDPLHLHLLLVLHPPVLEPDLDLSLRQVEHARHLNSSKWKMLTFLSYQMNCFLMELVSGRGMQL